MEPSPEGAGPPFPIDPATQRWGLGDVAAGILASLVLSTLIGGLVVTAAGWSGTGAADGDPVPIWGLALLQLPLWGGYLGVTLWATSTKVNGALRDLGVQSRVLDAPVGLVVGVAAQLVVLPLLYLPILELTGRTAEELSEPARNLADRAGDLPEWVLFGVIVGAGAPVVEELFYRGLFLRSLRKAGLGGLAAVLLSSLVFAGIHFQPLQFPGLFAFGVIAAGLTTLTGRLGPAIWAHVGFNLTTVVVLYHDLQPG